MGLWTINGGNRLYGTAQIQGSKNGALAVLAGCLAVGGVTVLERVPRVTDVELTLEILRGLGCCVKREGDRVTVDSRHASMERIPTKTMEQLRSSVLLLGAMLARFGEAAVAMPVGSRLGPRPVDLHISALQTLGAQVRLEEGLIACDKCVLRGGEVSLPYPSVGATENAMLAACGSREQTVIRRCAKEPEVVALAEYLRAAGMEIFGEGTDTIVIRRRKPKDCVEYTLPPDRIAASALLCAVGACGGKLILKEVISSHLQPILDGLGEMGCNIKIRENEIQLQSDGILWAPTHEILTGPYPAFPTDVLPMIMAACLKADGVTVLRERVFSGTLKHAALLRRFGGDVTLTDDCVVVINGVSALRGTAVKGMDPLSGMALLIAALQAEGESGIVDGGHIARSFSYMDAALRQLGAELEFTE